MFYNVSAWDKENNPYLMQWADAMNKTAESVEAWLRDSSLINDTLVAFEARRKLLPQYGFAIPDETALRMIAKYSPRGVLEIGAGTGYWSMLLRKLGVDVVSTDSYTSKYAFGTFTPSRHVDVLKMTALEALSVYGSEGRTLLICWPDYKVRWSGQALRKFTGITVAYVGEEMGGCTGNSVFHQTLGEWFTEVDSHDIPQWEGLHDDLTVYRRK